jgi:NADPH-dependent 2,4-dienoyl-CoA reductase/sulfur reductase-like enzyme
MARECDVAVIGAGASGVAASVVAARSGCRVMLIDVGDRPGGQYYRGAEATSPGHAPHLVNASDRRRGAPSVPGLDYTALAVHLDRLAAAHAVDYRPRTTAYALERAGQRFLVHTRGDDRHRDDVDVVDAGTVVLATGAFDRPLPFPGWTLPGVMTGGGAQSLVKGQHVLPGHRVVVAGTGPFLLAVAATLLERGAAVAAVVEANDPVAGGLRQIPALAAGLGKAGDLGRFIAALARHRVPYLRRHRIVEAVGNDRVTGVRIARVDSNWHPIPGTGRVIDCDAVTVGFGFVAQLDLAAQLGARTITGADGGLAVEVDYDQATSVPGLLAAGETTGIGGVEAARVEGLVAGATAAVMSDRASALTPSAVERVRREVARWRRFADGLHATFPVRQGWVDSVREDTLVCRCEEVPLSRVREAVALGARDARTVKLLSRAGMGWCQGRMCAEAVDGLCGFDDIASLQGASYRPLAAPVPLGALAAES